MKMTDFIAYDRDGHKHILRLAGWMDVASTLARLQEWKAVLEKCGVRTLISFIQSHDTEPMSGKFTGFIV